MTTATLALDTNAAPAFPSLKKQWGRAAHVMQNAAQNAKHNVKVGAQAGAQAFREQPLKTTFNVAVGAGSVWAVKSSAVALATTFGAGAVAATAGVGAAYTTYSAIKDYRKDNDVKGIWNNVKSFFGFLNKNKMKYGTKLALSSGLAVVGGNALVQAFNGAAEAAERTVDAVPSNLLPEEYVIPEPEIHEPTLLEDSVEELRDIEVINPLEKLSALDPSEFTGRAAEILSYAEKAQPWAMKEMASYLLYSGNGAPLDQALAVELYEMARDSNVSSVARQAANDLAFIESKWGIDNIRGVRDVQEFAAASVDVPDIEQEVSIIPQEKSSVPVQENSPAKIIEELPEPKAQFVDEEIAGRIAQALSDLEPAAGGDVLEAAQPSALANLNGLNEQATNLRHAALNGDMQALGDIGIGMLNGWYGFDADPEQGLELLREAAAQGNEWHQTQLAMMEFGGHAKFGIEADRSGAIAKLSELAQGDHGRSAREATAFLNMWAPDALPSPAMDGQETSVVSNGFKLMNGEDVACQSGLKGDSLHVECLFDERSIKVGQGPSISWPGTNTSVDLFYMGEAYTAAADQPFCETKQTGRLVEMSCEFSNDNRFMTDPFPVDIAGGSAKIGVQFDTPPLQYAQR